MSGLLIGLASATPWVELTGPGTDGMVFMKPLLIPRVMELAYAPGFQSPPHAHRVDEIFFVLSGRLSVNKHELCPGSVLYVPRKTKYGPEYSLEEGAHILRVELFSNSDRDGHLAPRSASKPWQGPTNEHGTPAAGRRAPVPSRKERVQHEAPGVLSASPPESWEETARHCRTRRLLAPNLNILEVNQGNMGVQAIASTFDVLIYVLDGQIMIDDKVLTRGSTCIVPRGSNWQVSTTTKAAHYLRISLEGGTPPA